MTTEHSLTRQQKETVALLSIGTFLEYFDLMIYVHMAVLLNELFFPPTDPKTAAVLAAFAFCSTYVLRPFGALIFGYIGDNYGRKPTVIITTTLMSCCCLIMAFLPTYAEIGITAAIIVSVLRIVQGMSSMGEIMGANVFMAEITKPPIQYFAVGLISVISNVGSMMALGVAALATSKGFNWRLVFFMGTVIALVGMAARTKLRETPEFTDAKRKATYTLQSLKEQGLEKPAKFFKNRDITKEEINIKDLCNYFAICCGWPFSFYLIYIYFIPTLKKSCNYSPEDIITHNFYLSICIICASTILIYLSQRIYPLYISRIVVCLFTITMIITPFVVSITSNNYIIFTMQMFLTMFGLRPTPSDAIFIKHFPVFNRFTSVTFCYALSRAIMYVIISFGLIYLTEWFGFYGIWVIGIPIALLWIRAIYYYASLEKEVGNYPLKGQWQVR